MLVELPLVWTVVLNVVAWALVQLGVAWGLTQVAPERFQPMRGWARPRAWEARGRFYERVIRIKNWKDQLPDGARWFAGGYSKGRLHGHTETTLYRFACETWRGELVHWLAMAALPLFWIWNPGWAMLVNGAYALAANLPCIIVQRYNRARLHRVLNRGKLAAP